MPEAFYFQKRKSLRIEQLCFYTVDFTLFLYSYLALTLFLTMTLYTGGISQTCSPKRNRKYLLAAFCK